jgi:hypothetical protein
MVATKSNPTMKALRPARYTSTRKWVQFSILRALCSVSRMIEHFNWSSW